MHNDLVVRLKLAASTVIDNMPDIAQLVQRASSPNTLGTIDMRCRFAVGIWPADWSDANPQSFCQISYRVAAAIDAR
jgi:hypothetical protein